VFILCTTMVISLRISEVYEFLTMFGTTEKCSFPDLLNEVVCEDRCIVTCRYGHNGEGTRQNLVLYMEAHCDSFETHTESLQSN
jgi:hypothetical protein